LYLFKLGMAPQIEDLYGKVNFTGKAIQAVPTYTKHTTTSIYIS